MTALLLAAVGHRDLLYRGEKVVPPRAEGRRILDNFDSLAGDLTLPMLSPVVQELLRSAGRIQVVLYGTDQPEGTLVQHRDGDTVHLAGIAAKLLKLRHGRGIDKVLVRSIPGNPSLYDDMLAFFRGQFQDTWTAKVEDCYVFPVGGTPAANMGLTLAAIERFGEKSRTLYLPEGEKRPVALDLGEQIQRGIAKQVARERLKELSFRSTIPLLRRAGAPGWVVQVARYAGSRYHFDFDSAAAALEEARRACADDWMARSACEQLRQGLLRLRDREPEALLSELYHNAQLAYQRSEFAAFLGIAFRFQEAVLRYSVEQLYPGLSTEVFNGATRKRFQEQLASRGELLSFLQSQKVNGEPLKPTEPSRPALAAMLRYAWEGTETLASLERVGQFRRANESLERFDCLASLRNKSVIAHGFEGISEERITNVYAEANGEGHPREDMAAAMEALGIGTGDDPFEEAAKLILEGLK